ncbi:MAG: hypothetical protein ACRDSL_22255 [Pseudonocardiaceae bacterium]
MPGAELRLGALVVVVLSDRIIVKITSKPGESFVDRMIALVQGAQRQRRPTRSP